VSTRVSTLILRKRILFRDGRLLETYFLPTVETCSRCAGTGRERSHKCRRCQGTGNLFPAIDYELEKVLNFVNRAICPENQRYKKIRDDFGNRDALLALNPVCNLLLQSPTACESCPANPDRKAKLAESSSRTLRTPQEESWQIIQACIEDQIHLGRSITKMENRIKADCNKHKITLDELLTIPEVVSLIGNSDRSNLARAGEFVKDKIVRDYVFLGPNGIGFKETGADTASTHILRFLNALNRTDPRHWKKCAYCGSYFVRPISKLVRNCFCTSTCKVRFHNRTPRHKEWIKENRARKSRLKARVEQFFESVRVGDLGRLTHLIQQGVDVNEVDELGATALMLAAEKGSVKMVKFLLDSGVNPRITDEEGWTALQYAEKPEIKAMFEQGKKLRH